MDRSGQERSLTAGIKNVQITWVLGDVTALPPSHGVVPAVARPAGLHVAPVVTGNADGGVVLLGSTNVIGIIVGGVDMVELGGAVILFGPGLATVVMKWPKEWVRIDLRPVGGVKATRVTRINIVSTIEDNSRTIGIEWTIGEDAVIDLCDSTVDKNPPAIVRNIRSDGAVCNLHAIL